METMQHIEEVQKDAPLSDEPRRKGKRIAWILLIAGIVLSIGAAVSLILYFSLRETYLEKLPYDDVDGAVYNNTMVVSKDGLWYLWRDGELSEHGYTYLKNLNDFYTGTSTEQKATRRLFDYYLAKDAENKSYWLIDGNGAEYRIAGDNFSLTEVTLPYLIFTNNTNSRKGAISLSALSSELSAEAEGELAMTKTFLSLSAHKYNEESELYDYLLVSTESETAKNHIYSAAGKRLVSGGTLSVRQFENANQTYTYYFVDETTFAVYSADGVMLSDGETSPILAESGRWGYQISASLDQKTADSFLLVFGGDHAFTLSSAEYDLSTLRIAGDCLILDKIHTDHTVVVTPEKKLLAAYDSVTVGEGILLAYSDGEGDTVYLGKDGRELYRSPYDDLKVHDLSTQSCTVLVSDRINASESGTHSYFFTAPEKTAVRLDLPLHAQVVSAETMCIDQSDTPVYLVSDTDSDGTPLWQIYTPFSANQTGSLYHAIDFYCHGGIVWALGTSYTSETYDILDPFNNRVSLSISAKSGDLARLAFTFRETSALLANPSDPDSTVPMVMLQLTRYEEKQSAVTSGRYFVLYRSAYSESDNFQTASLRVKEVGQNLLLSTPFEFFRAENCLAIHSVSGSQIYRLDDALRLTESASIPYHVAGLITDRLDPTTFYMKISPITDGNASPLQGTHYGLTDSQGNLLLAPCYEQISDASGDRFVVTLRNAQGMVQVKNGEVKTLIDFEFDSLTPLRDGGYLALRRDGKQLLYEDDRLLEGEDLRSVELLSAVLTDEDGFLTYAQAVLVNIGGELQIHLPDTYDTPVCNYVSVPGSHSGTLLDRRAKLVSYYDTAGVLIKTDLLIPTATDEKAFTTQHTGEWYTTRIPDNQSTPISAGDVLNASDRFFHLYPKAEKKTS